MYILIIGGGKVGYYLAKTLIQNQHKVGIIESNYDRCNSIINDLDAIVINGDGTDIEVLHDAGATEADYVVAVTGKDQENLVVCQLAKKYFKVPRTIARVNNPKNQVIFKKLGVDATISSTGAAAQLIENELPINDIKTLSLFQKSDIEIIETELKTCCPVLNLPIRKLDFPEECVLIAIIREDKVFFPKGETILQPNDKVFALAKHDSVDKLKKILLGGRK
jgi:trk system potassium uptake protein TrkA